MLAFILFEAVVIFTRKHPVVSIKELLNNMDDSHGGMAPFHYGFDFAVGIKARTPPTTSINGHRRSLSGAASTSTNGISTIDITQ